jgi:hypothetical protein
MDRYPAELLQQFEHFLGDICTTMDTYVEDLSAHREGQGLISLQSPSEMTSTVPSTTLMAVLSSMAYVGTGIPDAHF